MLKLVVGHGLFNIQLAHSKPYTFAIIKLVKDEIKKEKGNYFRRIHEE
jgi:hypothetical protein